MVETEVLIVGGGPVGLALACELGWRGVRCVLVERRDGSVTHSKMNMVSTRSMEHCRRWGIAEEVRRRSIPEDYPRSVRFVTSTTGFELFRFDYPSRAEAQHPHSPVYLQRCPQSEFDPLLRETAKASAGIQLTYRTELQKFEETTFGVRALVRDVDRGTAREVNARYLVGCDGAGSHVREQLGIELEGDAALSHDVNLLVESDDFNAFCPGEKAVMQWIFDATGYIGSVVAVDGRRQWRIGMRGVPIGKVPTEEEARAFVERLVGRPLRFAIRSILPWTRRRVVAERYRKGRAFLAGDAAHQLSPTGGFGMNTGIGDAIDLAWKLEAVLKGWGGPSLLDSYEAERQPIGQLVTDEGARNFSALTRVPTAPEIAEHSPRGAAVRTQAASFIRDNGYEREYETEGISLGYRYERSPIIVHDGDAGPAFDVMRYRPSAAPGHRAPHAWLEPSRSTLDLFGHGFTLLGFAGDDADTQRLSMLAAALTIPLRVVRIECANTAALYEHRLVLVRPDGHVAWRANRLDGAERKILDKVCGRSDSAD